MSEDDLYDAPPEYKGVPPVSQSPLNPPLVRPTTDAEKLKSLGSLISLALTTAVAFGLKQEYADKVNSVWTSALPWLPILFHAVSVFLPNAVKLFKSHVSVPSQPIPKAAVDGKGF